MAKQLSVDIRRSRGVAGSVRIYLLAVGASAWTAVRAAYRHRRRTRTSPAMIRGRSKNASRINNLARAATAGRACRRRNSPARQGQGDSRAAVRVAPRRDRRRRLRYRRSGWQRPINPISGKKYRRPIWRRSPSAVSDVYRAEGFHLSRAIVPPQDIQGGAASHSGHRRQHHGSHAEGRRRRAVRCPADAGCRAG